MTTVVPEPTAHLTSGERHHRLLDSPIGSLILVEDQESQLVGIHMVDQNHLPPPHLLGDRDDQACDSAARQLAEYFDGQRTDFDVAFAYPGTDFQRSVWSGLQDVGFGLTHSYGELAARIGRPKAVRAVAQAASRNPIAIVVPCHRLIGSKGQLTGYAGGLDRKRWLLQHETAVLHNEPPPPPLRPEPAVHPIPAASVP